MKKWQKIVTICLLVANAIILIYQRNWTALIWEFGCAYFLYLTFKEMDRAYECVKLNIELNEFIHYLTQHDSYKQLIEAERKSECYLANCNRALKKMITLKKLNAGLFETIRELKEKIAYKNLIIKELKKKNGKDE